MNALLRNALALASMAIATHATAQVTFYEDEGYEGRSFTTEEQNNNLRRNGLNNRASSVVVARDWWEVCEDIHFGGRCVVLRPGRYPSLRAMGMNDSISSVRPASRNPRSEARPYMPGPVAPYDFHRRYFERTFEANVTSVRAVVGPPEQRCWVEREQVVQDRNRNSVAGGFVGAVIGGILGHQIGSGGGQDLATAGGAVAGAVVGANIARDSDGRQVVTQDVQHCASGPSYARPEYWDVTYTFRGQEHRVQMINPPGPTVTVNEQGEPRE